MKKIGYLIFVILLFICFRGVNAYTVDNTIKVYDYALVLTDKQSDKLKMDVSKYINKYNLDMVLVTVKHYNYPNLIDYSKAFYKEKDFGLGANKSGIIMVVDLKNNNIVLNTFGDATKLYDDIEIDNMISKINKNDKVYDKFTRFIKYSNKYIKENSTLLGDYDAFYSVNWLLLVIISSILPTLIVTIVLFKIMRASKHTSNNYYIEDCNVEIHKRIEKFITTNTKQVYKNN